MLTVHTADLRDALHAEVRVCEDWYGRQQDFGSPQWKLDQIRQVLLEMEMELEQVDQLAELGDGFECYDLEPGENPLDMEDYDLEDLCDLEVSMAEDHSGLWDC